MLTAALILADHLGNDVLSALDGGGGCGDITTYKTGGCAFGVALPLEKEDFGEGLEALLAGYLGPGAAFGLIREVDILEFGGIPAVCDALLQFRCQFVKVADGLENRFLTLLDFLEPIVLGTDGCNLYLVEPACPFLAIAGNKGNGAALVEQCQGVVDSPLLKVELLGNQ